MPRKSLHAARLKIFVNGRPWGLARSFSFSSATPRAPLETIDSVLALDLMPTRVRPVGWSMDCYRTAGDGGIQGPGLVAPNQVQLASEMWFSILIVERATGLPVFYSTLNQVDAEQWRAEARDLLRGTVSGQGVTWTNEASSS